MSIYETVRVATPDEKPIGYSPSWRGDLAKVAVNRGLHILGKYLLDDIVYLQYKYLIYTADIVYRPHLHSPQVTNNVNNPFKAIVVANSIRRDLSDTKDKLEALLMCRELSVEDIAKQFKLDVDDVQMYERLFFNLRDERYDLTASPHVVERFITKNEPADAMVLGDEAMSWRALAFEYGQVALFVQWGWPVGGIVQSFSDVEAAKLLLKGAYRSLATKLQAGKGLGGKETVQLMSDLSQRFDGYREDGIFATEDTVSEDSVAAGFLSAMTIQRAEMSEEVQRAKTEKLAAKLSSMGTTKQKDEERVASSLEAINMQMENKGY